MKRTKILATYGPAIASPAKISQLVRAGVNAFRVNCSHGDRDELFEAARIIRAGSEKSPFPIGLLFDISGPKLRLGRFEGRIPVTKGKTLTIRSGQPDPSNGIFSVNHPEILKAIKQGQRILIDDGSLAFDVVSAGAKGIVVRAQNNGTILPSKGINLPRTDIPLPTISEKDRADIKAAVLADADFVALSFVRSPDDITHARRLLKKLGGKQKIYAKLEKREAIEQLEEIMALADGVMVARGDLGVELPPEEVPRLQKRIVQLATRFHKPVIVATQMLESMRYSPRATRAEVNDVATAVFDRADAVMLSAETATGDYPLETVRVMKRIIEATESDIPLYSPTATSATVKNDIPMAIAEGLIGSERITKGKVIFAYTSSGFTAELIANLMPPQPVIALTDDPKVMSRLALTRSVYPILADHPETFAGITDAVNALCKKHRLARRGDRVFVTGGIPLGRTVPTNMLIVHEVK